MITLLTGIPGHGKTLFLMSTLCKEYEGRDIYYHGIKDCMLDWTYIDKPELWYELPPGSVIFIDEAQKIFPSRPHTKPVPQTCSEFETHRHQGLDIVLVTQKPKLIDHHVRDLVGAHYHVIRTRTGHEFAMVFKMGKVVDNVKDERNFEYAEKIKFKYPKEAYDLYKSAELHTVKKKIPLKFFVFPALITCLMVGIYFMVGKIKKPDFLQDEGIVAASVNRNLSPLDIKQTIATQIKLSLEDYLITHTKRIDDISHSAPFYDELYIANSYPRPQCINSESQGCKCYTQQASRLEMSKEQCINIVEHGYFDPTKKDVIKPARDFRNVSASL